MDPSMLRFERDVVTYLANLDYNLKKYRRQVKVKTKDGHQQLLAGIVSP